VLDHQATADLQHAHRLAQGRPADVQKLRHVALARQLVTWLQLLALDQSLNLRSDPIGQSSLLEYRLPHAHPLGTYR
jgi:hypothetical protein